METINLVQGTPEWHQHRAAHDNASDLPAVMGLSSYKTRDELLHEKKTGIVPDVDAATQRRFNDGHKYEAMARAIVEKESSEELYPVVGVRDYHDLKLSASFDGIDMMETWCFEHKSINDSLRQVKTIEDLDKQYKVQMQQQMMVSGADRCMFVASNGTKDDWVEVWFNYDADLEQEIIAAWKQFHIDLEAYEPAPVKAELVANPVQPLPSLNIQIQGAVTQSNLTQYRDSALAYIDAINTDLQTDQDFADAEANVKFCKQAEDELKAAKQAAISKTADIDDLMKSVDYLAEQLRQKRLTLEKLVKAEKENRKRAIANEAITNFEAHIKELEKELAGLSLSTAPTLDIVSAMKGKRTISSLQNAANTALAQAKIDADMAAKAMRNNLAIIADYGDKYQHLFSDLQQIIIKDAEDFDLLVQTRVKEEDERVEAAKQAEAERLEKTKESEALETRKDEPEQFDPEQNKAPAPKTSEPPKAKNFDDELTDWARHYDVSALAMNDLYDLLTRYNIKAKAA